MKRLKLTPEGVDNIVNLILSDESLVDYVVHLVKKRLTKEARTDTTWCNQVIDLSIEEVLSEVNIGELIDTISKTVPHSTSAKSNIRKSRASNEEPELLKPQFSSTEPHAASIVSPRRMLKELNKNKLPDQELSPVHSNNRAIRNRIKLPVPDKYDRSGSVESDASTIPVGEAPHAGVIIAMNEGTRESDDWQDVVFRDARLASSSMSSDDADLYISGIAASEANGSFREDSNVNRESSSSSSIGGVAKSSDDSPQRWIEVLQAREPIDNISEADSLDQETPRDTYDASKSANIPTSTANTTAAAAAKSSQALSSSTISPARTIDTGAAAVGSAVTDDDFLNSWEKQVLRGMKTGEESGAEDEDLTPTVRLNASDFSRGATTTAAPARGRTRSSSSETPTEVSAESRSRSHSEASIQSASPSGTPNSSSDKHSSHKQHAQQQQKATTAGTGAADEEEEYSSDEHASESEEEDNLTENYLHPNLVASKGQLQMLFFDQSLFDADADYFGAVAAQQSSPSAAKKTNSPGEKKNSSSKKNSKDKSKDKNQGGEKDEKRVRDPDQHVRFAPKLISEVRYRDRVGYHEKGELFFTHNEEYQFTLDQSKEAERAEAVGLTWMEWMDRRTDEDVQREEQEEALASLEDFKLYSGEYYEEDETVDFGSCSSPTSSPGGGHDLKSANAHASPVAHSAAHHADMAHTVSTVHPHKAATTTSSTSATTGAGVFNDELSVPSCSDDDDEYDFDNF